MTTPGALPMSVSEHDVAAYAESLIPTPDVENEYSDSFTDSRFQDNQISPPDDYPFNKRLSQDRDFHPEERSCYSDDSEFSPISSRASGMGSSSCSSCSEADSDCHSSDETIIKQETHFPMNSIPEHDQHPVLLDPPLTDYPGILSLASFLPPFPDLFPISDDFTEPPRNSEPVMNEVDDLHFDFNREEKNFNQFHEIDYLHAPPPISGREEGEHQQHTLQAPFSSTSHLKRERDFTTTDVLDSVSQNKLSARVYKEIMTKKELLALIGQYLINNNRGERDFEGLKRTVGRFNISEAVQDELNTSFKQKVKNIIQERRKRAQLETWKVLRKAPNLCDELRSRLPDPDKYEDAFLEQLAEHLQLLFNANKNEPGNLLDWPHEIREVVIAKVKYLHQNFYGNRIFDMYEDLGFLFALGDLQLAILSSCDCSKCREAWSLDKINQKDYAALKLHWTREVCNLLAKLLEYHIELGKEMFDFALRNEPKVFEWDVKHINVLLRTLHTSTQCSICKQNKRTRHRGADSLEEFDEIDEYHNDNDQLYHHAVPGGFSSIGKNNDLDDESYFADLSLEQTTAWEIMQTYELD